MTTDQHFHHSQIKLLSCCSKGKKNKKKSNLTFLDEDAEPQHQTQKTPIPHQELVFSSSSPIFTVHSATLCTSSGSSEDFYFYQVQ